MNPMLLEENRADHVYFFECTFKKLASEETIFLSFMENIIYLS